jgi:hypothetical protein
MKSKTIAAALGLAFLSGCCWITQGTTQPVLIDSKPSRAEFRVTGRPEKYVTPATVHLSRSEQVVKFNVEGYSDEPYVLTTRTSTAFYFSLLLGVISGGVDLLTGSWQEFDLKDEGKITFTLKPTSNNPEEIISISSNPQGATILIKGVEQPEKTGTKGAGATKIRIKWANAADREREITLRYENFVESKALLRRGTTEHHRDLVRVPDKVLVMFESEPKQATVLVDGQRVIPETPARAEIEWPVGDDRPKKVEFRKTGYLPIITEITKKDTKTSANLLPDVNSAILKIDCFPPGAMVAVDDKEVGTHLKEVSLQWSIVQKSHKLRFSRPGYVTWETTVEEAKRLGPLQVRLQPSLPGLP